MDDIFEDLILEGVVVVYLDDILIFTETLEEHWKQPCRLHEAMKLWILADLFHVSRQAVCRSACRQKTTNFYDLVGLYQGSLEIVKSCAEML